MASQSYQDLVNGDLSFTDIVANEVDYGNVISFLATAQNPIAIANPPLLGIGWGGFHAGASGANSSTTVTVTYTLNTTDPTESITAYSNST